MSILVKESLSSNVVELVMLLLDGLLSEDDKAVILNRTKKYICNNNFYAIEAIKCGCEVVDTSLNPIDVNIDDCQTYSNYFESLI